LELELVDVMCMARRCQPCSVWTCHTVKLFSAISDQN